MRLSRFISAIFILLLFFPQIQRKFKIIQPTELAGSIIKHKNPPFTFSTWLNGEFQRLVEARFISKLGFRSHMIKTENQLNFSLFRQISANPQEPIIMGEDNWLFEESYIKNYISPIDVNRKHVMPYLTGLKELQTRVRQANKAFCVVISASKASTYPEMLPEWARNKRKKNTVDNYQKSKKLFQELDIIFVDTPKIFKDYRKQSDNLLFAKGGTHWNYLGALLIVQEMIKKVSPQLDFSIPEIILDSVSKDNKVTGTDNDLGELLNLWLDQSTIGDNFHPHFHVTKNHNIKPPKVLFIGCSFVLTLSELLDNSGFYQSRDTLYYNKRLISFPGKTTLPEKIDPLSPPDFNLEELLEKADIIVFEINETVLPLAWMDFVRDAVNVFRKKQS